jgi:PmbA protein
MRGRAPGVEAEVFVARDEDRALVRRDGRRESVETSVSFGAGVRVADGDGRVGFASAGAADAESLRVLWARAVEQLPHAGARGGRVLPAPSDAAPDEALAASLWDASLFTRPWEALEERLAAAEAAVRDGARVLRAEISESRGETVVASTRGVFARERGGSAAVSLEAAADDGAQTQVGEGFRSSRRFDALDVAGAGREAARRATAAVGAGRVRAGRRAAVLEPWIAAEFLELLADPLSAEEVQGGRSLLAGRLGEAVASPLVTLRDDPRLMGGPASGLWDDEGVPTRDKALIEGGVLRELLYDTASAAREGRESNGCGWRGGWRGLPSPGTSNLRLAAGALTRDALIADTKDGLLILEVLGAHMVDPVSGEFSVGVSGLEISGGRLGRPFKGAMLSGSLLDLLARVDAVADDAAFYGGVGSPTLRVSALDAA